MLDNGMIEQSMDALSLISTVYIDISDVDEVIDAITTLKR